MKILEERLELLGAQRNLAALHCQKFTDFLEASLSQNTAPCAREVPAACSPRTDVWGDVIQTRHSHRSRAGRTSLDSATTLPRASSRRRSSFESATSASASLAQLESPSSSGKERSDGSSGRRSRRLSLEINKATTEYYSSRHLTREVHRRRPHAPPRGRAQIQSTGGAWDEADTDCLETSEASDAERFLGGPRGLPHTQAPAQSTRENKGPRTRGLRSIFKVKLLLQAESYCQT